MRERYVKIELLDAIAEHKHVRVGMPNKYNLNDKFLYYGYPVKLHKSWLILDIHTDIEAVPLNDIITAHAVPNKVREKRMETVK